MTKKMFTGLVIAATLFGSFATAAPLDIRANAIDLFLEQPEHQRIGKLRYRGGLELRSDHDRFGGLSGLLVEGDRLTAVSDRGDKLRATIAFDDRGFLAGLRDADLAPLRGLDGGRLRGKDETDSEALARGPDGRLLVAFERDHRVLSYSAEGGVKPFATPRALALAPNNGGLEALTRLADGRYLAITEKMSGSGGNAAWIGGGGDPWQPLAYAIEDDHFPTGAATLPNGDVLVVERFFTIVAGVSIRVRRLPAATLRPGAVLRGDLLAEFRAPAAVDNFEGIAVQTGKNGALLVYLLSDDNFNAVQRTLLLAFELAVD